MWRAPLETLFKDFANPILIGHRTPLARPSSPFSRLSIFKLVGGWMEPLQTEKEGRDRGVEIERRDRANFAF